RISSCTLICAALYCGWERPSTGIVVHDTTAWPSTDAAALSGWPSKADDSCTTCSVSSGNPANAFAATTPATAAEAEEPKPRDCGILLVETTRNPGASTFAAFKPERMAFTTRCEPSRGRSSSPSLKISTSKPDGVTSTSTVS